MLQMKYSLHFLIINVNENGNEIENGKCGKSRKEWKILELLPGNKEIKFRIEFGLIENSDRIYHIKRIFINAQLSITSNMWYSYCCDIAAVNYADMQQINKIFDTTPL